MSRRALGRLLERDSRRELLLCLRRPRTWALTAGTGVLVFVFAAASLVGAGTIPSLFGCVHYTVYGGSMEPALRMGSVAVTRTVPSESLEVGDIIAFPPSDRADEVLIHRIVGIEVEDGERVFTTKGDQNPTADPRPVKLDGDGAKLWYSVPLAGYIIDFAHKPVVRTLLVLVPLGLFAGVALERIWWPKRGERGAAGEESAGEVLALAFAGGIGASAAGEQPDIESGGGPAWLPVALPEQAAEERAASADADDDEGAFAAEGEQAPAADPRPAGPEYERAEPGYSDSVAADIDDSVRSPSAGLLLILIALGLLTGTALQRIWRRKRGGQQAVEEERVG